MEIENTFWVFSSYGNKVMWHFYNFTQPDGTHLMPCLINLTLYTYALPLSLSLIFFFPSSNTHESNTISSKNPLFIKTKPIQELITVILSEIQLQNLENL